MRILAKINIIFLKSQMFHKFLQKILPHIPVVYQLEEALDVFLNIGRVG